MKVVCGKCSAEVELPKEGESPDIHCPSCGAVFRIPSLADGEPLPRPDTFPGYRIVAIVGHGGMGSVYRAVQLSMDREVAIKVLLRKCASVPRFVARFEREAAALALLSHPNIVAVIDRGRVEDMYYFVMEYVHGRTLRYFIKNNLLSLERSLDIAIQVCQALEAAHAGGIIHRDIKPGNILLREDGPVKVADFGIAHMVEEGGLAEQERRSRLGTARYMAPEQHGTGEAIDPRADVYALGVTLFEMLTGTLPRGEPPSRLNPLVPAALDQLVARATRENRGERFQSATELREALAALRDSVAAEETPATGVSPVPELAGVRCSACGEPAGLEDRQCPHCGAPLYEPCYRAGCEGMNPVGAERCASCGGHLELLKRQRRSELEALLEQAHALAAARPDQARRNLEAVAASPYEGLKDLRARAGQAMSQLRSDRLARRMGGLVTAAAVLLLVGAIAAAVYLGYLEFAPPRRRALPGEEPKPPATSTPSTFGPPTAAPVIPPPPRPRPVGRRGAFDDYLIALTDPEWPKHLPALRVSVACDAGLCFPVGSPPGKAVERLATSLAEIQQGKAQVPDAAALSKSVGTMLVEMHGALAARLPHPVEPPRDKGGLFSRFPKSRPPKPRPTLASAAAALEELLAAEARTSTLETPTRLLLLDASLAPLAAPSAARQDSDQLIRAGRLLLRYLFRQADPQAALELLDDARQRLDRAEREPDETTRLAYALEALVELEALLDAHGPRMPRATK